MSVNMADDGATRATETSEAEVTIEDAPKQSGGRRSALKQAQEKLRSGSDQGQKVTIDHTITQDDFKRWLKCNYG